LYAAVGDVHNLTIRGYALRVVAPGTGEGTAFQKDGDPDARAVIDGLVFNVAYVSGNNHNSVYILPQRDGVTEFKMVVVEKNVALPTF
jgi:hypothetical protein